MKTIHLFLLAPLALLLTACPQEIDIPESCEKAQFVASLSNTSSDDFAINSASVLNDELTLSVSYGGGCGPEVDFDAELVLLPTMGPLPFYQIQISLKDNDNCEALLTETICFDLSEAGKPAITKGFLGITGPKDSLQIDWE